MDDLIPYKLAGYADLVAWLRSIGVAITVGNARVRAQRERLPGRLWRGRAVFFRSDLRRWVLDLTGCYAEEWILKWEQTDQKHPLHRRPPHWHGRLPRPRSLITALRRDDHGQEQVIRGPGGEAYIRGDLSGTRQWPEAIWRGADSFTRWTKGRVLMEDDWDEDYGPNGTIKTLIVPFRTHGGEYSFPCVAGSKFGAEAAWTPLIAGAGWSGWAYFRDRVRAKFPDCVLTVWEKRTPINRARMWPSEFLWSGAKR